MQRPGLTTNMTTAILSFLFKKYRILRNAVPYFNKRLEQLKEQLLERLDQPILEVIDNPEQTQQTTAVETLF